MNKQTEIEHLRALQQGDTYFAQFFGQDIDTMVQNIKKDFSIELDCAFIQKEVTLQRQLKNLREEIEQVKFDLAVALYREYEDCLADSIEELLSKILGSNIRKIEAKLAADVPPTKEEVAYLISMAKCR